MCLATPHFIHSKQQKSHPQVAFYLEYLVGDTWIEHVTPAV